MINGISPLELNGMVSRTQDFSIVKHHDDVKPMVDQNNFQTQVEQNVSNDSSTVKQGQETETRNENNGGSKGAYGGDGGQNRKKKNEVPDGGRVLIKGQSSFDITI